MNVTKLFFVLLCISGNSYSQERIDCMWFVHAPTIYKTPATLEICVCEPLTHITNFDGRADTVGIGTNLKSYTGLKKFIKINNSLFTPSHQSRPGEGFYEIRYSDGNILYLRDKKYKDFINRLILFVKKNFLDQTLITFFEEK